MLKRRTQFVAPFVITVAGFASLATGCARHDAPTTGASGTGMTPTPPLPAVSDAGVVMARNPPTPYDMGKNRWDVVDDDRAHDGSCEAMEDVQCPPPDQGTCNPPPLMHADCPPPGASTRIMQRADDSCVWLPKNCGSLGCVGPYPMVTACPSYQARAPHTWHVTALPRTGAATRACTIEPVPRCTGGHCPGVAFTAPCPGGRGTGEITLDTTTGVCMMDMSTGCPPGAKCDPPPPQPVPCPVAPPAK